MPIIAPNLSPLSLFDGRVCKACGFWLPITHFNKAARCVDGREPRCKSCRRNREWERQYASNPEVRAKKREHDREYYQRNAERIKAQVKDYYWATHEQQLAYGRSEARRAKNREREQDPKRKAERRAYYASEAGKAMMKAAQRRYYQSEHGKLMARLHQHRRRTAGILTADEWLAIVQDYGESCAYCGATDRPLHIEHVIPIAKGGQTTRENIVPACKPCNSSKCDQIWTPRPPKAKEIIDGNDC